MIATVHATLALLAGALDAAVLAVVVLAAARRQPLPPRLLDRLILALEGTVGLAIAVGLGQVVAGQRPADGLHLLYALVALIAMPIGRSWRGLARGPRVVPLALAGVVVAGVLVRLLQTG